MRDRLERRARPKHLLRCAELAKKYGMDRLKLYLMVGTPGETDADVDECIAPFSAELSRIPPRGARHCPVLPQAQHAARWRPVRGDRRRGQAPPAPPPRLAWTGRYSRNEREVGVGRIRSRPRRRARGPCRARRRQRWRLVSSLRTSLFQEPTCWRTPRPSGSSWVTAMPTKRRVFDDWNLQLETANGHDPSQDVVSFESRTLGREVSHRTDAGPPGPTGHVVRSRCGRDQA